MNWLYTCITIAVLFFVIAIIYTIYYFREEFRSLTAHSLYKAAKKHALIPVIVLFALGVFSIIVISLNSVFNFRNDQGRLQFTALGEIGDLFNGLLGPFIALLSVVLFYKAYKEQIRTNSKNDEFQLLEYCHSRLTELSKPETISLFENHCDIYLLHGISRERREKALRRVLSTLGEFNNIKGIVSEMELHSPYLKNQYLTVMFDYYYPQMIAINDTIIQRVVIGGQMIEVTVGIESNFTKIFREYNTLLKEEEFI